MRETQQKMRDLIAKYENEIKNAKDEHVQEIDGKNTDEQEKAKKKEE